MGGMQCYGPIVPEPNEPVFHADWEKKGTRADSGDGFYRVLEH